MVNYQTNALDTLYTICNQFNINPYRLRELNPLFNLDQIQYGMSLLVEVGQIKQYSDESPKRFRKNMQPDSTFMKKPLFQQIPQVEHKFNERNGDNDTDEFKKISVLFSIYLRYKASKMYIGMVIDVAAEYVTYIGNIPGVLTVSQQRIVFNPNISKLINIITDKTTRSRRDIKEETIDRYKFNIMMEDVYLCRAQKDEVIEFTLYGILGVDPPMFDAFENISLAQVKVVLKQVLPQPVQNYITKGTSKLNGALANLITNLLCTEEYVDNTRIYRQVMRQSMIDGKLVGNFPNDQGMHCNSTVSFYELIPFKSLETKTDRRSNLYRYKQRSAPILNTQTAILEQHQFQELLLYIPSDLNQNDWFLIYSPSIHGTSYQELMRRCSFIGPHVMLLRDSQDIVFGAYLSDSWVKRGDRYYGKGESFVFSFVSKLLKVYNWTKKNDAFQMANEEGLHIGADDKPAIEIGKELLQGYSSPCETFDNPIFDMEIWGLSDHCEALLRSLRQKPSYFGSQF